MLNLKENQPINIEIIFQSSLTIASTFDPGTIKLQIIEPKNPAFSWKELPQNHILRKQTELELCELEQCFEIKFFVVLTQAIKKRHKILKLLQIITINKENCCR